MTLFKKKQCYFLPYTYIISISKAEYIRSSAQEKLKLIYKNKTKTIQLTNKKVFIYNYEFEIENGLICEKKLAFYYGRVPFGYECHVNIKNISLIVNMVGKIKCVLTTITFLV